MNGVLHYKCLTQFITAPNMLSYFKITVKSKQCKNMAHFFVNRVGVVTNLKGKSRVYDTPAIFCPNYEENHKTNNFINETVTQKNHNEFNVHC